MARREPQRRDDRQGHRGISQRHQRVVDDVEPLELVELDAPPIAGDAVELLVSVELGDVLPDVEPVPVAPIELVPSLGDVPVVPALPVVVLPPSELEPVVEDGEVDAVDEVDGVEPGVDVLLVVDEVVLDSRFVHAPSERAATTASTPAVTWVRVIFIRNSLNGSRIRVSERAAETALPRL